MVLNTAQPAPVVAPQPVVITADEEQLLQKLEARKQDILSLIAEADTDSSAMAQSNNEYEKMVTDRFAELIESLEAKKESILLEIGEAQRAKNQLFRQHVVSLKQRLKNIVCLFSTLYSYRFSNESIPPF